MTIKQFIESAIEGGWVNNFINPKSPVEMMYLLAEHKYQMFLDPKAWKAVGKVKGWSDRTSRVCVCGMCRIPDEQLERLIWASQMAEHHMHMMVMNLFMGVTLEEYIATL